MAVRSVVVTGASTGIGWGIAGVLVRKGFRVFGTVRQPADADRLQAELGSSFTPLLMEVTDQPSVEQAADRVREFIGRSTLAGLVNNAGISVVGPLLHMPLAEFRRQIEVNLISSLLVTQSFADLLGTDRTREGRPGRIVNISFVGAKIAAPFLGAYAASKHALEGRSESLRRELMLYGIDLILIEPGYVNTPVLDKTEKEDYDIYRNTDYAASLERFRKLFIAEGRKGLLPQKIGEVVYRALTARRPKVIYVVAPQKFKNWILPTRLPKRFLDRLIARRLHLLPVQK